MSIRRGGNIVAGSVNKKEIVDLIENETRVVVKVIEGVFENDSSFISLSADDLKIKSQIISVNLGNSVILPNTYSLSSDGKTLNFVEQIEQGTKYAISYTKKFDIVGAEEFATQDDVSTLISEVRDDMSTLITEVKDDVSTGWSNTHTNCITEIPQDIKLELVDGTLTLKAGSKVYVPKGVGVFDAVNITSDIAYTRTDNQDCVLFYRLDIATIQAFPIVLMYSGETAPTGIGTFAFWYDTANNFCKVTGDGGSSWASYQSLPLALIATDGTKISEIKQVYNGFGFVGSTVFALPGVKGLIPNGRNEDGTLRSIAWNTSTIITRTFEGTDDTEISFDGVSFGQNSNYHLENDGYLYNSINVVAKQTEIGRCVRSSGKITSFQHKTPFQAVDYNDFKNLDNEAVKITGNQTITGVKGFTDQITRYVEFNSSSARAMSINDVNNKGKVSIIPYYTNATVYNRLLTENTTSGKQAYLDVQVTDTGDATLEFRSNGTNKVVSFSDASQVNVPTPTSATDNSNKAATTAWVTSKLSNDSGVVHTTGDETITGAKTFSNSVVKANKEFISTIASPYGQFRAIGGNYGFFIRNDGTNTYFLLTASEDQYGTWTTARPLTINNSTGELLCSTGLKANAYSQTINALGNKSGTVSLATNNLYTMTGTGSITFSLPTATSGVSNGIRILYYQAAARTITWGTTYFYNGKAPDMTAAGYYDIYFDYNPILRQWVCGAMTQKTA